MKKMKLDIQLFGASVSLTASATSATDETAITTNQNYINLAIRVQTTKPTWNGNKTAYYQVTTTSQNNGTQTGSKYYFSIGSSSGSGDKTFNVTLGPFDHNADGTLNDVSISVYVKITDSTNRTATKSVAMGTIPRASIPTLSSSSVNMGSSVTIYTNRYSSSFTHTITYAFGSASGTIATNLATSVSWTPPLTLANQIPNATSGVGTITCITYSGSTEVGRKSISITLNVPSSVVPTISNRSLTENGSTPSNWGVWVKTKSKIRVQTTASGIYGSSITSISTTLDGYTYQGADVTSNFLNTSGSLACITTITDSRGRQASSSTTISVQDYYNPSFSVAQIQRCDVNGNADDNGAYCYFNFGGSVATCSNKNKGTYRIKYKLHSASTYTEIPAIATNVQSLSTSGFITDDGTQQGTKTQFSTSDTYDFVFSIQDQFTTSTNNQTLDTGFDLMNFNPSGKAMAIGKVSEAGANEELFEVGINTEFDGDIHVSGVMNQTNPSTRIGSNLVLRGTTTYPEASINVANPDGSHTYIFGYGVGGDVFGIYSAETSKVIATIDNNGNFAVAGENGNVLKWQLLPDGSNVTLDQLGDNFAAGNYCIWANGPLGTTWYYVSQNTLNRSDTNWRYQEIVQIWTNPIKKYRRLKIGNVWTDWKLTPNRLSFNGPTTVHVRVAGGWGFVLVTTTYRMGIIHFLGAGNAPDVNMIKGDFNEMSFSWNGNLCTITGLFDWEHYMFDGSEDILDILL